MAMTRVRAKDFTRSAAIGSSPWNSDFVLLNYSYCFASKRENQLKQKERKRLYTGQLRHQGVSKAHRTITHVESANFRENGLDSLVFRSATSANESTGGETVRNA